MPGLASPPPQSPLTPHNSSLYPLLVTSPQWNWSSLTTLPPRTTKLTVRILRGCIQRTRSCHTWYLPSNNSLYTPYAFVYFAQHTSSLLKAKPAEPLLHPLPRSSSTTKTLCSRPSDPLQYGCRKDAAYGAGLESGRSCRRCQVGEVSEDDDVQSETETRNRSQVLRCQGRQSA